MAEIKITTIQNQTYPSTSPCWIISRWASSLEILWWNQGWERWIAAETEWRNTKLCMKWPQFNHTRTFYHKPSVTTSECTPTQARRMQTYPCSRQSSVKRPWGYRECPGVNILFSAQRREKQISAFWVKQTQITIFLKNMNPSVPSMRDPLQLQLRGLPWDSLWLCFSGLRSPLLPGNSLIYFSGKKNTFFFTMKICLKLYCSALLAIRLHSRMWFPRWLAGH